MKKILSLMLVLSFLFSAAVLAEDEAKATLKVVGGCDIPGRSVEVSLIMENNPGIVAMKLELSYDDTYLTLRDIKDNGLLKSYFGETKDLSDNPYTLCWADMEGFENNYGNGVLAVLTFDIAKDAPEGDYEIEVSYNNDYYEIMNEDLEAVEFEVENGVITVAPKPSVSFGNVVAKAGDEVCVDVILSDSVDIGGISLNINFDKDMLSFVGASSVESLGEGVLSAEETTLSWNLESVKPVSDGVLATLRFKISDLAKKGIYKIKAENGSMTDKEGLDAVFEVKAGEINVIGSPEENIPGDADGNGTVNSLDAIYLSFAIKNPDKYPLAIYIDVNKDGIDNEMDAVYLLKHVMLPEKFPLR